MKRLFLALSLMAASGCSTVKPETVKPLPAGQPAQEQPSSASPIPYRQEVVARGLDVPWAIDLAPDGRIFFTERPGHLRVVDNNGKLLDDPAISFEAPFVSEGEGGLLGVALDPQFQENHYLYVYHSYKDNSQLKNRVLRLVERDNKARVDKVLIDTIPGAGIHNGGRLKIGPDGCLYITTGDAHQPGLAQDRSSLAGKILRIRLDGSIPADNPFPGSPIYSLGHRNPQGLAWQPESGSLYSSEHGQSAHDEINRIQIGFNYGWPLIQGDKTRPNPEEPGGALLAPLLHSGEATWAPSGMTFLTKGPWKGQLLVANLRGRQLLKLELNKGSNGEASLKVETILKEQYGRLRDVLEAPDGSIYLLTNNRDGRGQAQAGDDRIIRFRPDF
ncbi:PQQ-dependent sugar dehydrogenase [Effusibacillus lacus]|uniref:Glucose sorbosone dehydrogenase n=1 Tax=Effusibacillus lacus TaxID=1348429 RepID=A0A292YDR2_9BACL|nr:PQQ-dependent sugar dehydrogenase [Effusibacillus lacus]TCS76484.1 glucose/arabinose dehydrogenase [Effusibacillus lacus]GAX90492.1 glucose sorbosone dehydrogenase [Effusibacillus lacus]